MVGRVVKVDILSSSSALGDWLDLPNNSIFLLSYLSEIGQLVYTPVPVSYFFNLQVIWDPSFCIVLYY